ncbi:MAG: 30S ribosomal protein S16 [Candidatus Shikimatogenerans bostrichidophilus]|nr:MAG: 30S ribosomal protein S16 [Candidatus Shikimatogenerans bostrichidophilus]
MIKIRLQRKGKKHYSIYSIVLADSKKPRDGKIIKKLGIYNPNLNNDKKIIIYNKEEIIKYLKNGAQPTKTVKSILKQYKIKK